MCTHERISESEIRFGCQCCAHFTTQPVCAQESVQLRTHVSPWRVSENASRHGCSFIFCFHGSSFERDGVHIRFLPSYMTHDNPPVNEPINHPQNQRTDRAMIPPISHLFNQASDQSCNQGINESSNHSTIEPTNQPTNHPTHQSINHSSAMCTH